MSILGGVLGIDIGAIVTNGIPVVAQVLSDNTSLQIAQLNLQAQQQQTAATALIENSNASQTRLLITGGLVLAASVIAVKVLRKK